MKRRSLLTAVRDRMRRQAAGHEADARATPVPPPDVPVPASPPAPPPMPTADMEQLEAEARYHRDRYELYRARVQSGSSRPTSAARLRELERTATAAAERLAYARRSNRAAR